MKNKNQDKFVCPDCGKEFPIHHPPFHNYKPCGKLFCIDDKLKEKEKREEQQILRKIIKHSKNLGW